jgi:hypothetical protein
MRSIPASGSHYISMKEDQVIDLFIMGEFSSLIHAAVFVLRIPWPVLTEPSIQPIDWWSLAIG